jgi:aspartate/methionine/tyrosine aminotransferase
MSLNPSIPMTLTEVETLGLSSEVNLADGHAYQELAAEFRSIIRDLPAIWQRASDICIPEHERRYMNAFGRLIGATTLAGHSHFSICPSASNSIDTVAAWLRSKSIRTGLLEPTFDNLALILRRREVELQPVTEAMLRDLDALSAHVSRHGLGALFIVNPNNPTGRSLTQTEFEALARWSARKGICLIVDKTFRFYAANAIDDYRILMESGATFVSIEDTGKTFPTLDLKASALVYSANISAELRTIYQEIYLSISAFTLAVMTEFFEKTIEIGWERALTQTVRHRRHLLRESLAGTGLRIPEASLSSTLSVEWIDISATGLNDIEMAAWLQSHGITVLPGRFFFWNTDPGHCDRYIRVAMMKPWPVFAAGLQGLRDLLPLLRSPQKEATHV